MNSAQLRSKAARRRIVAIRGLQTHLHQREGPFRARVDLRQIGTELWGRFTASRDETLWYYRACLVAFRSNAAHRPELVDELERTVTELERVAAASLG